MQPRGYIRFMTRLWTFAVVCWCMSSCSMIWSEAEELQQCKVLQTVSLNLTIAHPDASIHTRAELEYDDLTFSRNEASVKSLTAFLVDLNADGTEIYGEGKVKYFSTEIDPSEFKSGIYVLRQTLEVETGVKHVYVGANLKEEHIKAFINNKPLTLNGEGPAVNMVMTSDPSHTGQGTDIAMFGQLLNRNDRSKRIEIKEDTRDYYLHTDLERLTAKVLLTCKEDEDLIGYVETEDEGWVEISKVRYMLNATNRHTYINKHRDESYDRNIDPNWKVEESLVEGSKVTPVEGLFESWKTEELRQRLFDERFSTAALKYDETKIGEGNKESHYTEGIYCLENTTFNDSYLIGNEKDAAAKELTTHIVIAIRFIPKKVYTGGNVIDGQGPTQMDLDNVFTKYLVAVDGHEVGTYWTRTDANGKVYYYGDYSKKEYIKKYGASEKDFTCYEGGWSYYTTFIDGTPENLQISYAGRECWGVERDHYYILSIDKITKPGAQIPSDEYIRVNSKTIPWVNRGSKEVIIKPKGE